MAKHTHKIHRSGWLRAAVMGANDGIVSTASLIMGVAAAGMATQQILLTGVAGLVAGAMSMAAGEYVSVSSQADTEKADLDLERRELARDPVYELQEMTNIYMARGLSAELAEEVARQLTEFDALGTHARDELGISPASRPRPILAALTSAVTFCMGAALPLLVIFLASGQNLLWVVALASLISLALLGALAAHVGGASKIRAALRVTFWSASAMLLTSLVGSLFGVDAAG
jgi:vacuolar iron transporter family protein